MDDLNSDSQKHSCTLIGTAGGTEAQLRLFGIVATVVILRWFVFEKHLFNALGTIVWPYIVHEVYQATTRLQMCCARMRCCCCCNIYNRNVERAAVHMEV